MTSESSGRILSLLLLFAQAATALTSAVAAVTTTWWLVFVAILACYALIWWWVGLKATDDGKFGSLYTLASLLTGYLVPIVAVLYVLATQDPPARILTGAGLILVLVLLFLEHVAVKAVDYLRLAPLVSGLVVALLAGLSFGAVGAAVTVVALAVGLGIWLAVDLQRGTPPVKCGSTTAIPTADEMAEHIAQRIRSPQ